MELDFFEVTINGRFHPVGKRKFSPADQAIGKDGYVISIYDSNIEAAKQILSEHKIEHISVSTSNLDFLADPAFKNLKGVSIQGEHSNLSALKVLESLKYLDIFNERKGELDFKHFPNLIQLNCDYSKKYKNIEALINLQYLYLNHYSENNLERFKSFTKLRNLSLLFGKCESLVGLGLLSKMQKLILDECRQLRTLDGLSTDNTDLNEIQIKDCLNLKDLTPINQLKDNLSVFINGEPYTLLTNLSKNPISYLVKALNKIGTDSELLKDIQEELQELKQKLNNNNWEEKLRKCIFQINELNKKHDSLYTEEREGIIRTIQYLLIDFNSEEVETIINDIREW